VAVHAAFWCWHLWRPQVLPSCGLSKQNPGGKRRCCPPLVQT
jgi:hypothetical protein